MNQAEETELVRRAMGGDDRARMVLWSTHRRWLAAVLMARKPSGCDLEDLLQDVAMRFVSQVHTLQNPAALRPWLRAVALNVARGAIRSASRRAGSQSAAMVPLVLDDVPDPRQEQAQRDMRAKDRADHVLALIGRLQPDYREPLLLRCVRGLSQQQVAAALDLPITTVETRLARARRMLRRELAENPPDEHDPWQPELLPLENDHD